VDFDIADYLVAEEAGQVVEHLNGAAYEKCD